MTVNYVNLVALLGVLVLWSVMVHNTVQVQWVRSVMGVVGAIVIGVTFALSDFAVFS